MRVQPAVALLMVGSLVLLQVSAIGQQTGAVRHLQPPDDALTQAPSTADEPRLLGEGVAVPPAPPPGPAPNDVTQALLEAQASTQEKAEQAKMYLKPPGCRPTTSYELRNYATYKTNCTSAKRKTSILLDVTGLEVTQINDGRHELSVTLGLRLSWKDSALSTQPVEALWQPQKEVDFLDVVQSRMVGSTTVKTSLDYMVTVEQVYEVTVKNDWDYSKYPFDTHRLSVTIVTPSLTQNTEPISTPVGSLSVQNRVDEFQVSRFDVQVSSYGSTVQGAGGSWGYAQQIKVSGNGQRKSVKHVFGSVLPIFLTPLLAYAGFFLTSDQIIARVTLGGTSLLAIFILYLPVNLNDGMDNVVGFALDSWLSWFTLFQILGVCVCIMAQAVSHMLLNQDQADKSTNLDLTFKLLFPMISTSTLFAAYAISHWNSAVGAPVCLGLLAFWCIVMIIVLVNLDKKTKLETAKSKDFPGI